MTENSDFEDLSRTQLNGRNDEREQADPYRTPQWLLDMYRHAETTCTLRDVAVAAQHIKDRAAQRGLPIPIGAIRDELTMRIRQHIGRTNDGWRANLMTTGRDNRLMANIHNAALYLVEDPVIGDCIGHNEFSDAVWLRKDLSPLKSKVFEPRLLEDGDIATIRAYLEREGMGSVSRDVVSSAARIVAKAEFRFNPVTDYLEGLEWDGEERIELLFSKYLGAEASHYTALVGRKSLIQMVARAMCAGCKADCVPILEGPQGRMKSTALRVLAGQEYFGDNLPDIRSKDASSYLQGMWLVEIAEFHTFRKADVDNLKAFISRQEERYRKAYGEFEVVQKRTATFWGTTNDTNYLADPTGARRFWPVECGVIDIKALRRDRDQLLAEAKYWYDQGESWWPEGGEAEVFSEEQARRRIPDPWEARVLENIKVGEDNVHGGISAQQLLDAIKPETAQQTAFDLSRVGKCLRAVGYESYRTRGPHSDQVRRWRKIDDQGTLL